MAIMRCTCENTYQDVKYGKGKRVHNKCTRGWRCTICLTVKT
jgi:hypothetical protein